VPVRDVQGKVVRWYGTNTDIEDLKRAESLLAAEKRVLEMISGGAGLTDILDNLCRIIDAQTPDTITTVLLLDPDGTRLWPTAGPRVPSEWTQAITPLPIGPCAGSCGTAAFRKKPVITSDIASDPLWAGYQDLALSHGLRASWSQPLISKNDEVLGTFAMYFAEPRSPSDSDLELIKRAGHIAQIAIERKRAEEELRRSEDYLAQAQKLSLTGSFGWNVSSGELFWSKETFCILGYDPATKPKLELVLNRVHPEDLAHVQQTIERASRDGIDCDFEHRLLFPDGSIKHVHVMAHVVKDDSGKLEFIGAVSDVTATKMAEEKIRQDERELRRIVDLIPQVVIVTGPDGAPLYANRVMLDYTGVGPDEVPFVGFGGRLSHSEDVEKFRAIRQESLAHGVPFQLEQRMLGKDGFFRWFLFRYNPLKDDSGKVARWYVTATDIHDRKQTEERIQKENLALREEIDHSSMFEEIVGSSEALRKVLAQVAKVAPVDSTVLILGETGTGKELVARAIHKRSKRSSRAFIRVNCAAIPSSLIASELFGHEKGAFTGALQRRLGRFELADGGTIFLDEVGDLPAETQIALLRVLQEREIERVGGSQPIAVDVRVLAATNRDLKAAVAAGAFRQDLFYRLNVFPIQVPSLRERMDDIHLLVEYFIERYGKTAGKKFRTINKKTLDLFQAYAWPGNIRELQNVIERAVILCDGDTFSVDETWLKRESHQAHGPAIPFVATLVEREKEIIEAALAKSSGRIAGPAGAATKLGIPRQTLESKIKSLGIDKQRFKARHAD
jgi:PAS domain S-box-containing protein